jgi:hypothetical protein
MYLTAHRVRSPSTLSEGINSFLYLHGPYTWRGLPPAGIPEANPGALAAKRITVRPPGNRVRSFLDVIAPDETPWEEIQDSFNRFIAQAQCQSLPWTGVDGRCLFRVGLELELAGQWSREVAALYQAAGALRIGASGEPPADAGRS